MRKISCFRLIFRQRFGGYEVGAFRAGRHAIGKRLIALVEQAEVFVKNFSHGAPPKFFRAEAPPGDYALISQAGIRTCLSRVPRAALACP